MRAKSNRIREGNVGRFQGRRKGKEKSFCFVVIPFLELSVICEKLGFTEWLAMLSERGVVYRTKRMGPSTEP